jgi:hypothetical protein
MRDRLKLGGAVAFAFGFAALTVYAEEPRRMIDASRALDAGVLAAPLHEVVLTATPADPPPLVERRQWIFDLRWDRGDVWLLGVHPTDFGSPQATPRAMGRFALELFEGPALVERVRFDFPLLGGPEPAADADSRAIPSLTLKLRTRIGVVFPATGRGTRLELVDRASNHRWSVPWPPNGVDESVDASALPGPVDARAGP